MVNVLPVPALASRTVVSRGRSPSRSKFATSGVGYVVSGHGRTSISTASSGVQTRRAKTPKRVVSPGQLSLGARSSSTSSGCTPPNTSVCSRFGALVGEPVAGPLLVSGHEGVGDPVAPVPAFDVLVAGGERQGQRLAESFVAQGNELVQDLPGRRYVDAADEGPTGAAAKSSDRDGSDVRIAGAGHERDVPHPCREPVLRGQRRVHNRQHDRVADPGNCPRQHASVVEPDRHIHRARRRRPLDLTGSKQRGHVTADLLQRRLAERPGRQLAPDAVRSRHRSPVTSPPDIGAAPDRRRPTSADRRGPRAARRRARHRRRRC